MTAATTAPPAPPDDAGSTVAPRERGQTTRDWGRLTLRIAWVVVGIQLVVLLWWSWVLYHRWGMTWDYAIRYQGWFGISHGNLDPYSSVVGRYFWQDHFELINWPLAPLARLWPNGVWPLWIQDAMVAGGELGAIYLVVDATRRRRWPARFPPGIAIGLVTLLLVANPWLYESVSFDFHFQSVGAACFAMLACREMVRGRLGLMWLWAVLCVACGDIAATYLAAVGLGGVLLGRSTRRRGLALLVLGVGWYLGSTALGGGKGSSLAGHYQYLAGGSGHGTDLSAPGLVLGVLRHPVGVFNHLWARRVDLWAYSSSAGGLGLFTPLSVLPVLVLFEGGASTENALSTSAYENFGALLFIAPLSVLMIGWLTRQLASGWLGRRCTGRWAAPARSPAVPLVLAGLMAVNAVVWAAVWTGQVRTHWLTTGPSTAAALNRAEAVIPPGDEVVASQGVVGRFCGRTWCYQLAGRGPQRIPLRTAATYVVVVPYQGIETTTVRYALSLVGQLSGTPGARLVSKGSGVWVFRLERRRGQTSVRLDPSPTEPAWAVRSQTGTPVVVGPPSTWHMVSDGSSPGYVVDSADWNLAPGGYRATVTMASTVPATVEVWDATRDQLLSRWMVEATNGERAVTGPVQVVDAGGTPQFGGWGLFSFAPLLPEKADRIEIRVWSSGAGQVDVYSLELEKAGPGRP